MAKIPTGIRVVCIALIDEPGRVLLQRRRAGDHHGGLWEFPGGKVEPHETGENALVREVAEELGLAVEPCDLRFEGESARGPADEPPFVLILYSAAHWGGEPQCLDAEAIGWFTPREAARLPVPPLDRPFIDRLPAIVAAHRRF